MPAGLFRKDSLYKSKRSHLVFEILNRRAMILFSSEQLNEFTKLQEMFSFT